MPFDLKKRRLHLFQQLKDVKRFEQITNRYCGFKAG
jgi:hypothetical protein